MSETSVYSDTVLAYLLDIQDILKDGAKGKHTPYITVEKQPILGLVKRAIELAYADNGKHGEDVRIARECINRLRSLSEHRDSPLTRDEVDNLEQFI